MSGPDVSRPPLGRGEVAAYRAMLAEQVPRCPKCGGRCSWNMEHEWWSLDCDDCGALVSRSES